MNRRRHTRAKKFLLKVFGLIIGTALLVGAGADNESLLLSDEFVPWQELGADFPERPQPITEVLEDAIFKENRERRALIKESHATGDTTLLDEAPKRRSLFGGNPFLASGDLYEGFEVPGGAVWQPVFIAYGTGRTALQISDNGTGDQWEWVNRLDFFGNLYLTPTERILFGIRPLDRSGSFSGYGDEDEWFDSFNGNIRTLFFEGDFGELFPNLDPTDERNLDFGFSIGRQPLNFQDGILLNDTIDSIGVSRASLFAFGSNATRITAVAGSNQVHRGDARRDPDANLYGLFTSMDYDKTTLEVDFAYVDGDEETGGDGFYAGIGDTRRIGAWSSTTRLNVSLALDEETPSISDGLLLTSQLSRTMTFNDDIFYLDTFWGNGDYTSAARDPSVGGPLGVLGILYSSPGLGNYATPLGNDVGDSVGGAIGYQHFFAKRRGSLIAELGGRVSTDGGSADNRDSVAFGLRYQRAVGQHSIFQMDAFVAGYEDLVENSEDDLDDSNFGYGLRAEWEVKF